jgi:hypothetical protein
LNQNSPNLKMNLKENTHINKTYKSLERNMTDFIELGEADYTSADVQKCMSLLEDFLDEIAKTDSRETGIQSVKKTVLAINHLNESCEYELVETEQREKIVDIIIFAGHLKGYNHISEDITEEWREW